MEVLAREQLLVYLDPRMVLIRQGHGLNLQLQKEEGDTNIASQMSWINLAFKRFTGVAARRPSL